ncbi:hypothetical protein L210DRAFT_3643445 [Boletus edulis BED1]|uniref:Heterokaryon incompatibility domain-containing protein n=1 Tax=Boletus edulis BED1 TaxID=1328754 RepID=A0AAD4GH16_BOLED|nr:hypothetical protein L210DRAFT_3643445 [Boletus edulis BED1]
MQTSLSPNVTPPTPSGVSVLVEETTSLLDRVIAIDSHFLEVRRILVKTPFDPDDDFAQYRKKYLELVWKSRGIAGRVGVSGEGPRCFSPCQDARLLAPCAGLSSVKTPTIILEESLRYRVHKTLDVSQNAKYGRFRLVDCTAFLDHSTLRIKGFLLTIFPIFVMLPSRFRGGGLLLFGPLKFYVMLASPPAIEVQIWLDQLCILQARAHSNDKHAQIKRMHQVYRSCVLCIVIPGGLQRLVCLDEETPWIRRSWTLQESLSPPKSWFCLRGLLDLVMYVQMMHKNIALAEWKK